MPLRPARAGRVGVIRAPVAKTAVVASAVTPGRRAGGQDRGGGRSGHPPGGPPPDLASGAPVLLGQYRRALFR